MIPGKESKTDLMAPCWPPDVAGKLAFFMEGHKLYRPGVLGLSSIFLKNPETVI